MEAYLITGTSRGLGEALASQLTRAGHLVMGMARSGQAQLEALGGEGKYTHQQVDLRDMEAAAAWVASCLEALDPARISRLVMIHNAALLHPIRLVGRQADPALVHDTMMVNLHSPMRMTEVLLQHTRQWALPKQLVMISSGAARNPMPSWSTYCTSKAALDMFARCVAKEQETQQNPWKVVALAPGVVETFMQQYIRTQPEEIFPGVKRFTSLHADGLLSTPEAAAAQVIRWLNRPDFGQEVLADVRND